MFAKALPGVRPVAAVLMLCLSLNAAALPKVGEAPPDYVGKNIDGDKVMVSQYRGKVLVVTFWATWCQYCLKELPILNGIKCTGKDQIAVLAVNTEERSVFRRVVRMLKNLDIDHSYDPDREAQDAYGNKGIPFMVIIGRDGKVVAVHEGYGEGSLDAIVADLNRALAAPEAVPAA